MWPRSMPNICAMWFKPNLNATWLVIKPTLNVTQCGQGLKVT
jgi:hypothetical protein